MKPVTSSLSVGYRFADLVDVNLLIAMGYEEVGKSGDSSRLTLIQVEFSPAVAVSCRTARATRSFPCS